MKTYVPQVDERRRKWYLVDARGKILGRLATEIAKKIRGKDSPLFTPFLDMGASVVVVNAEKIRLTGKKSKIKQYFWHTGYPAGMRSVSFEKLMETHPEQVIERAVQGMLPKNRLGRKLNRRLFIYTGPEHPHKAQKPEVLDLN